MESDNPIRRIVPGFYSNNLEASRRFYLDFLGMNLVMDMGWIVTFASPDNPTSQVNIFDNEDKKTLDNSSVFMSVEVSDVDKIYKRAHEMNCEIIYDIQNEPWGVRRFFVKDPKGAIIHILTHNHERKRL